MPDDSKLPAVPDRAGLDRIYRAVGYVEQLPRNAPDRGGRRTPPFSIRTAKVTTTITARSGTTSGIGKADLYHHEGADRRTLAADAPAINVDVVSDFGVSIAVGTIVKVYPEGGNWNLLSADCP
jgi:hypothetical protein